MVFNSLKTFFKEKKESNKENVVIKTIIGEYLFKDKTELISEKLVKRYGINKNKLIDPFGYYNEREGSVLYNSRRGPFPDGVYVAIGLVCYPGQLGLSYYNIAQFNLVKSRGIDLRWAAKFQPYPNLPKDPNIITPIFPLFRIGKTTDYKAAKNIYLNLMLTNWTLDTLKDKILALQPNSLEDTIYKLRLALQRKIEKEKLDGN